jgi:predicted esterase
LNETFCGIKASKVSLGGPAGTNQEYIMCRFVRAALMAALLLAPAMRAAEPQGYHAKVNVTAPTRLDWTFVLSNQSRVKPPADWLPAGYDSTKQQYELFVPPRKNKSTPLPAIIFLSPSSSAAGWKSFEKLCRTQGVLFASPLNAGNDCPQSRRVRIILDMLDDLRRNSNLDPDRTYLGGFSGGGRIACAIGFALPELFGGVIPVCASGDVRDESWLRERVTGRISVALLTGDKDFNHGEVTRLRGPYLEAVGLRTKVWVQPGLGHGIPNEKLMQEAFAWLEAGREKRAEFAKLHPLSRLSTDSPLSRAEQAKALLAEGKVRLEEKSVYGGLMVVKGVMDRWPDTPAGGEARKLLTEYEGKAERPWEDNDIAEQRRYLYARARALDAYVSGPLDARYQGQKAAMAKQSVEYWELILKDAPGSAIAKEAEARLPELRKLAGGE